MKRGKIIIVFLALLALLPLITAEIFIDQLHSLYNVGDIVSANVSINTPIPTSGFFTAALICGVNELETHKSMQILSAGEEKTIQVLTILENSIVGEFPGECFIRAFYGAGEARSQSFKVSRGINIEVITDSAVFDPGSTVSISGKVVKENRELLNGFIEVTVEGIGVKVPVDKPTESFIEEAIETIKEETDSETTESNETIKESNQTQDSIEEVSQNNNSLVEPLEEIPEELTESTEELQDDTQPILVESITKNIIIGSFSVEVIDGEFSSEFTIPEDAPPGNYNINTFAYDRDQLGNLNNQGRASTSIRVEQIINRLGLKFNLNSVIPESDFIYTGIIYDQAGNQGEGEIQATILKPDGSIFIEKLVKASNANTIFIESNYSPGFWEVTVKMLDLEQTKIFFVEEKSKISYTLQEGILIVRNLGNMPYKGPIEISIGEVSRVENINLKVGESKSFSLSAPNGEYDISVNDGDSSYPLGTTFLTGRAIGIGQVGDFLFGKPGVWVWSLVIVILLVIILIIIRKIIKKKYVGKIPKTITPGKMAPSHVTLDNTSPSTKQASHESKVGTLINKGEKENSTIIALKIKNLPKLQEFSDNSANTIDNALMGAKAAGSRIYVDKAYRIIIFSQKTTKSIDNDMRAITVAKKMEATIQNHNKRAKNKIEFGFGIHTGQMAVESRDGKLKFVSLGNTLSLAKRVADQAKDSILISEQLHRVTLGKIKVEKFHGTNHWLLKRVVDREHYEDFINKFMNRQKRK
jgi:hypothetical protein